MEKALGASVSNTWETIQELRWPAGCRGVFEGGTGGTERPEQPGSGQRAYQPCVMGPSALLNTALRYTLPDHCTKPT